METQNTMLGKIHGRKWNGEEEKEKKMGWGKGGAGGRFYQNPKKPTHSCGKLNLYYYLPSAGD